MKKQKNMGKRILAELIDMELILFVATIFMYIASKITGRSILYFAILFPVLLLFYRIIMELSGKGQTIGKMLVKMQILRKNGKVPSAIDVIVRNMVKIMPLLCIVLFPGIWYITLTISVIYLMIPMIHKKGYAIHDMVGETMVQSIRETVKHGIYGVSGMYNGTFLPLTREVVLGRSNTCNLVFEEDAPRISRCHCSITYNEGNDTYILTDLHSSYGTFLGRGSRVPSGQSVALREGEEFTLGESERFKVGRSYENKWGK